MLAVIELGWNQFIVRKGDTIEVKKQSNEIDSIFTIEALLTSDEEWKETKIWDPIIKWSKVELKVLDQYKWDKVRVFHMKSKKRNMKNKWFRPHITKLEILSIA